MPDKKELIAFGPVPSRRFGKSLGINNIPPKKCTYSCIYCQLGITVSMQTKRKVFYSPEIILSSVKNKILEAKNRKESIDYLSFVPDGEPTLDINLGKEIDLVKSLEIKIAVITNSSLIWKLDVMDDLTKADCVSIKIDAISNDIWKKINRPHGYLKLSEILYGISEFSDSYKGDLITETMLVKDVNDSSDEFEKISGFISTLNAKKSYISVPIRPPAERYVKATKEFNLNRAFQTFIQKGIDVEYLIGYEGNAFAYTGNVKEDILSITSVHPMKQEAVNEFLKKAGSNWDVIEKLIEDNKLTEIRYNNSKYYLRKF